MPFAYYIHMFWWPFFLLQMSMFWWPYPCPIRYNIFGEIWQTYLEYVGYCFALTKCRDDAASAYARVNCISKCLDSLFKRLVIQERIGIYWTLEEKKVKYRLWKMPWMWITKSWNWVSQEKCNTLSSDKRHSVYDDICEGPPLLDLIRSFLLKKDYFDELVAVEVTVGNFSNAA